MLLVAGNKEHADRWGTTHGQGSLCLLSPVRRRRIEFKGVGAIAVFPCVGGEEHAGGGAGGAAQPAIPAAVRILRASVPPRGRLPAGAP